MIKSLLLLVLCTVTSIVYGQADSVAYRKNALKINIIPPLVSATSEISYERMIGPNLSIVAGFGGNWSGNKSDFFLNSDVDLSFLNRNIKNRYLLAEVRHYIDFGECERAPHGFYVGGFIRYNSINVSSDLQFGTNNTNPIQIEAEFKSFNFGALIGYQIALNNRWLLDFEFGGFGYAPNWVRFSSSRVLSGDEIAQLSDAISQNFGIAGNYKNIELNSGSVETLFWDWTFRYAVSIGYRF